MASATDIATRYFQAMDEHDLGTAAACWAPGAVERLVGQEDLIGPAGVAELEPSVAWAGHADPVRGDVASHLRELAATTA